uniref:CFEM domain-containing protein n=1 Tax=Heterorhabditis bacteriophora TaxID=37862 RepID=A0A1I7WJA2_HETBA
MVQISYLTTVAPAHKIAHPSCPTRCTEGDFAVDVVGCPGSTHEYDCCTNPFFVTSNNFPQKILLVLLLLFSESSGGTHFSNLRISPFHEIVSKLFPFFVCDGFTSNYDFEASAFGVRGVPERCRSLTSKSTALKQHPHLVQSILICIFLLLKLVENTVFSGSSFSTYFVRLNLALNLDLRLFTNYKPNTTKMQESGNLFRF